ncbi:MAG: HAD family hydrolase [Clostridia bacterium]|nr:HAD family hydrolase [Clostridia bacterium]
MRYTDLIFDLYGTLVDIHTGDDRPEVWEKTAFYFGFYGAHYTGAQLRKAFAAAMAQREAAAGQSYECYPDIPFEQVMAQLFRDKGVHTDADTLGRNAAQLYRIASLDYLRLYPCVRSSLAALRRSGRRLWLLSNAQHIFTAYELNYLGLPRYFDGVLLSSDYGCRKPDIRFYQALLTQQRLDPAACLMIGNDRQTDIAGAKAAGLATLYMHTNLTPSDQAPADPALAPGAAPAGCRHMEYEGSDFRALTPLLLSL